MSAPPTVIGPVIDRVWHAKSPPIRNSPATGTPNPPVRFITMIEPAPYYVDSVVCRTY
jgi:hypothetical protein